VLLLLLFFGEGGGCLSSGDGVPVYQVERGCLFIKWRGGACSASEEGVPVYQVERVRILLML
jgi:hypothetical protein